MALIGMVASEILIGSFAYELHKFLAGGDPSHICRGALTAQVSQTPSYEKGWGERKEGTVKGRKMLARQGEKIV